MSGAEAAGIGRGDAWLWKRGKGGKFTAESAGGDTEGGEKATTGRRLTSG